MAPPRTVVTTSSCSLLLSYRHRKDERLSWPSWLTYSGRFVHISGYPLAAGRAQDSESSPVKDQRSTAEPRNRHSRVFRQTRMLQRFCWQRFSLPNMGRCTCTSDSLSYCVCIHIHTCTHIWVPDMVLKSKTIVSNTIHRLVRKVSQMVLL